MNAATVINALHLPDGALVNQRVPKKLLVENGAPTAADKRKINDGIEEIHWLASLKPHTIGVPEYSDETREYLEIALLSVILRPEAKAGRLVELIHRAIPYPLFLIMIQGNQVTLSLAHKRRAQNEADKFVLDGEIVEASACGDSSLNHRFLNALALSALPSKNLLHLYQGWFDSFIAFQTAQLTGSFRHAATEEDATNRRVALQQCRELEAKIAILRNAAVKEKQMGRRVELNLEIKVYEADLTELKSQL